jgi:AcrR family transcriptional regulator
VTVAQRTVFKKEMIVEAAFHLARESGWESVTARNIARRLGSSTMPLYSRLSSMEEMAREVRARAEGLMQDYQRRRYTGEALLDAAVGYVAFARDEKNLFRFLYVDRPTMARRPAGRGKARDAFALNGVVDLADQAAAAKRDPMVLKNWAFVHGLASLISAGVINLPQKKTVDIIREVAAGFYLFDDMQKKGKGGASSV